MDIPAPVIASFDLSLLKPWPGNPRRAHAVDDIARSIEAFGYAAPILIQKGTNRILAGHGRLEALKKLGVKEAAVATPWRSNRATWTWRSSGGRISRAGRPATLPGRR